MLRPPRRRKPASPLSYPLNPSIDTVTKAIMKRLNLVLCFGIALTFVLGAGILKIPHAVAKTVAPQADGSDDAAEDSESTEAELTLEKLFPEKGLFGPSANGIQFSADGRYAAYLYRDYDHRRHGNDLWIYDFETGENRRVTGVGMMSEFQRSARNVKEDRLKKHQGKKKKQGKDAGSEKDDAADEDADVDSDSAEEDSKDDGDADADAAGTENDEDDGDEGEEVDEQEIIESVDDKDADDEKSPRYSGISDFQWHPQEPSLLIGSEGDLYLMPDVANPELQRLTKTTAFERSAEFTPDGSGVLYSVDDVIVRIRTGSHFVEQINPRLPSGMRLTDHEISPDGKRLAIVARSGQRFSGARTVDIIRYRGRFAKSDSVPRTVSDDEVKPQDVKIYLFDLDAADTEQSPLIEVFATKIDEPRDVISRANWSPDSQQVTFCFYDQENDEVQIRLAEFPADEEPAGKNPTAAANDESGDGSEDDGESRRRSMVSSSTPEVVESEAKVVYRFKHYGGPNTPRMVSPDFAADSKHIVFVSEQSGFRHIHLLDPLYESVRQLTQGHFEVYPIRFSQDRKFLFVTATRESAAREMVYGLEIETGDLKLLGTDPGTYSDVDVSDDGTRLMANFVKFGQLRELIASKDGKVEVVTDSHPEKAEEVTQVVPEFFDFENRHGHTIAGMVFKPQEWGPRSAGDAKVEDDAESADSEPTEEKAEAGSTADADYPETGEYPLLIYVYGGPLGTRHSVVDGSYSSDGYFFQMYMAQKHGYVTMVVDPRGQSGYGGLFEKSNYEQVGKPQVEDLVDSVKHAVKNFNVDPKRVAIYGWSFGGFQTQMCMYTEPDFFQVGIAGAGPTQWENYNSWYTTGTVGPSRTGKTDQDKYSLIPLAKNLKGKLLLVHGMEDTNVLFQDTVAVYRALLQADKETLVDLFLDPTGAHGLGGDVKRLGRMRKYEEFLLRTIGPGAEAAGAKSTDAED